MDINLRKVLADAVKLGVADEKSEMLISDFLKTMDGEILKKETTIQRLVGEITTLKRMSEVWHNLIATHIRMEKRAREDQDRIDRMTNDTGKTIEKDTIVEQTVEKEIVKKTRKRRTKAEIKADKKK